MCCARPAFSRTAGWGEDQTTPSLGECQVLTSCIHPRTSCPHTVLRNLLHYCTFNSATEIIVLSKECGGYQFADSVFVPTYRQMHCLNLTLSVFQHWPLWLATSSSPQITFTLIL